VRPQNMMKEGDTKQIYQKGIPFSVVL